VGDPKRCADEGVEGSVERGFEGEERKGRVNVLDPGNLELKGSCSKSIPSLYCGRRKIVHHAFFISHVKDFDCLIGQDDNCCTPLAKIVYLQYRFGTTCNLFTLIYPD